MHQLPLSVLQHLEEGVDALLAGLSFELPEVARPLQALAGPLAAELLLVAAEQPQPPQAEQPEQPQAELPAQMLADADAPVLPRRRFARKSAALAAHMRYSKLRLCMARARGLAQSVYQRLAKAWDGIHGLRDGECAADLGARGSRVHKNRWSFVQSIRLAYRNVGARVSVASQGRLVQPAAVVKRWLRTVASQP